MSLPRIFRSVDLAVSHSVFSVAGLESISDLPVERRQRFGQRFVDCIKQFVAEHQLKTNVSDNLAVSLAVAFYRSCIGMLTDIFFRLLVHFTFFDSKNPHVRKRPCLVLVVQHDLSLLYSRLLSKLGQNCWAGAKQRGCLSGASASLGHPARSHCAGPAHLP